jgi:peptidoglycan hydrolase-like protein with peptidoglycan-binding domain
MTVMILAATGVLLAGSAFAQGSQSTPSTAAGSSITTMPSPGAMPREKDMKAVQEALKTKGYDPGPIDGVWGPKTSSAVKAFQKAERLPVTGHLNADTRTKLGVQG